MDVTKDGLLSLEELVGFFTSVGLGGADVLKYSEVSEMDFRHFYSKQMNKIPLEVMLGYYCNMRILNIVNL